MASSSQPPPQHQQDPPPHQHHQQIWRAIVGPQTLVPDNQIPKNNSLVYLFPDALLEYAGTTATPDDSLDNEPISCIVSSVTFHYTQQYNPYVRFLLQPAEAQLFPSPDDVAAEQLISYRRKLNTDEARRRHFKSTKKLKKSVFENYNISETTDLDFLDVANKNWSLKCAVHDGCLNIYNPEWRSFLENKNIVADDNVIFVRAGTDYIIGLMRDKFSEVDKVKVLETLRNSKMKAKGGETFEVIYFPRSEFFPFVVDKEKVDIAMGVDWRVGNRVRGYLTGSGVIEGGGVVEGRVVHVSGGWWKHIEVMWYANNYKLLNERMRLSPWQVECIEDEGRVSKRQKKEKEEGDSKEKEEVVKIFGVIVS